MRVRVRVRVRVGVRLRSRVRVRVSLMMTESVPVPKGSPTAILRQNSMPAHTKGTPGVARGVITR